MTIRTITGTIEYADGSIPQNSRAEFYLNGVHIDAVTIAHSAVFVPLDETGDITVDLYPNDVGYGADRYNVDLVTYSDSEYIREIRRVNLGKIYVEDDDGQNLQALLALFSGPSEPLTVAQEASQDAIDAAAAAAASAVAAALYDGPKVDEFSELASVTSGQLAVGEFIRVIETAAVYERVTTDADLDYTGSGGVMLKRVRNPDVRLSDYSSINDMFELGGGIIDVPSSVPGILATSGNMHANFNPGVKVKQTARSGVGAFVTNVLPGNQVGRIQNSIEFDSGIISGEDFPAPLVFEIASATTTTITFKSPASTVDDAYNGMFIQIMEGVLASGAGNATITDYVGSTRTATLSVALASAPVPDIDVQLGNAENAMGFAWGASNVRIKDVTVQDYPMIAMTPPVLGGKGVNLEQGVTDGVISGVTIRRSYTGLYLNAHPGSFDPPNSSLKSVTAIRATNMHFENCGSAITAGILDGSSGIPSDPSMLQAVITGATYHNCGFAPYRMVSSQQQKSGVINLMGSRGVLISDVIGYNDTDYITTSGGWPTDYPNRCGYGLSGQIGAVVWGHARATVLRNIQHTGDVDSVVTIGRVRALGDDAPSTGQVSQLEGWDIDGLSLYGNATTIVDLGPLGFTDTEIMGTWRISVSSAGSLVNVLLDGATNLILDLTEIPTGKRVIGTAAQILARGNTFADYPSGTTNLGIMDRRVFTIADDTAVSFAPLDLFGMMTIAQLASLGSNMIRFRVNGSPQCAVAITSANTAVTTGVLTGTTGVDGNTTISAHSDGKIYIENRRGTSATVIITIPAAVF